MGSWDSVMGGGFSAYAGGSGGVDVQTTASGPAIVDRGNAAQRLIGPSGITRGLPLNGQLGSFGGREVLDGRLSLGFVQVALIVLVLGYVWTRNVQGGG